MRYGDVRKGVQLNCFLRASSKLFLCMQPKRLNLFTYNRKLVIHTRNVCSAILQIYMYHDDVFLIVHYFPHFKIIDFFLNQTSLTLTEFNTFSLFTITNMYSMKIYSMMNITN
jgi:hypothetical protein